MRKLIILHLFLATGVAFSPTDSGALYLNRIIGNGTLLPADSDALYLNRIIGNGTLLPADSGVLYLNRIIGNGTLLPADSDDDSFPIAAPSHLPGFGDPSQKRSLSYQDNYRLYYRL